MSDWESDEDVAPPPAPKPSTNGFSRSPRNKTSDAPWKADDSFGSSGGGRSHSRGRGRGSRNFERSNDQRNGFVGGNWGGRDDYRGDRGGSNSFGGSRGGGFSGQCYGCGEVGHSRSRCPNNGGNFNGHGNGHGGGYGGGRNQERSRQFGSRYERGDYQPRENMGVENRGAPASNYVPEEELCDKLFESGISSGINFEKYKDLKVEITGRKTEDTTVLSDFKEAKFRSIIQQNIDKSRYKIPTPVQKNSIPIILQGRDLMSCAQTGSGKTAAFLLPIIHKLLEDGADQRPGEKPQTPECLIMTPTRELAIQIKDEARKFSNKTVLQCQVVYGGTTPFHMKQSLLNGVNIVVATPGRLKQFVDEGIISFSRLKFLVLDEADRMLDMGFMPDIERLIRHPTMRPKTERQTLMFSATFPVAIQTAAGNFLNDYLFLKVGIVGGANADVYQTVIKVSKFDKRDELISLLKDIEDKGKVLVFVEKKKNTDFLATYLSQEKFKATTIHGDRLQEERERALRDFRSGRMNILVATAVAARGLDIPHVQHVINYDLPGDIDEYVHRIGRTGRVGNTGTATSFYDVEQDGPLAKNLVKVLSESHQKVEEWLSKEAGRNLGGGSGFSIGGYGSHDIRATKGYKPPDVDEEDTWD